MHWPATPVERLAGFQPPHCPWRDCPEHLRRAPGYRFHRLGFYATTRRRCIPRFRCLACGRSFSRQSFAVSYYRKRPELLVPVAAGLVGGSAHRQLARTLGCSHSTVGRIAARLGRHAMLLMARARNSIAGRVSEPLVLDHFETFEFTQDYPFGVATLVGSASWYVYDLDPAPHWRSGRLSPAQQARLAGRPLRSSGGGYAGSTRRVLDRALALVPAGEAMTIRGDGHQAYERVVARHPAGPAIRLERYPNPLRGPRGSPRTPAARLRDQRLFPVDLLHKLLRHSLAHQRRKTIAFGRRLNAVVERLFVAALWRNFVKRRSERRPTEETPAMRVGVATERWNWLRALSRRLFPARVPLPSSWERLYRRLWTTPLYPVNSRHDLIRAY